MTARLFMLVAGILGLVFTWFVCVPRTPTAATQNVQRAPLPDAPVLAKVGLALREDGSYALEGRLGDAAEKVRLLAAAERVFGAGRVADALKLEAGGGPLVQLTLSGEVADEAAKTRATLDAAKMVGVGVAIDNQLKVAPAAVAPRATEPAVAPAPPPAEKPVAPAAAVSEQQRKLGAALSGRTIEFEIGSAQLSSRGRALLDELAVIIQAEPATHIEIQGHTDARGDAQANLVLSQARAAATLDYLVAKGVDAQRLHAQGYGQAQPIADNETAAGRRQNRRIDFLVQEGN